MKILFTRHGESLANTLHIISNTDLPHPLTENGCMQAETLADKLQGFLITRVYASPVLRARQTAEIATARLSLHQPGAPLVVHAAPGLSEYHCGVLEGRGDEHSWSIHNRFFHDWLGNAGTSRDEAPPGGETFYQIRTRLANFVQELNFQFGQQDSAVILCVSHGGTLRIGLPGLFHNIDFDFTQTHGLSHTGMIETEIRAGLFTCNSWDGFTFS